MAQNVIVFWDFSNFWELATHCPGFQMFTLKTRRLQIRDLEIVELHNTLLPTVRKNVVRGKSTALFNQVFFPEITLPLIFQIWQLCVTDRCYWIVKGGEFHACGFYVSFQNGEWILDQWIFREVQCTFKKVFCLFGNFGRFSPKIGNLRSPTVLPNLKRRSKKSDFSEFHALFFSLGLVTT
jgi:hypothetical protein